MEDMKKCLHATCTCGPLPLQDYCCDGCRAADEREQAGETPMAECHCEHADCGGQPQVQSEMPSMLMAPIALAEA